MFRWWVVVLLRSASGIVGGESEDVVWALFCGVDIGEDALGSGDIAGLAG